MQMARSCWSWARERKKKSMGRRWPRGADGFQQLERAVQKGHVAVGRDDVGAVGLHHHPVLDLEDLHAGVAPDEVGEDALVVRGQVLHQDKGHAGIGVGGHAGKEGLEGRQPPGRRADADDGNNPDLPGFALHLRTGETEALLTSFPSPLFPGGSWSPPCGRERYSAPCPGRRTPRKLWNGAIKEKRREENSSIRRQIGNPFSP